MENETNPIDVQKHLKGIEFPASKQALIEQAQSNSAPEEVMDALDALEEKDYQNAAEVSQALSDSEEEPEEGETEDDESEDGDEEEETEEEAA